MSVSEIPSYEEFFGLIDNYIDDNDLEVKEDDEKIKKMIAIALALLEEFYYEFQFSDEYEIASENFKFEMDSFNNDLKELLVTLFTSYILEVQKIQDMEYVLPTGVVETTIDIVPVIESGVDSVTDTLYADLKNKADFYKELAITTGAFTVHSNFRRAIKKLQSVVANNAHHVEKVIERDYMLFVYGQEALFRWRCSGINTCAWCYEIEAMGAMPLSWFPVDHINGRCVLIPDNPNEYSDEYKEIRGW